MYIITFVFFRAIVYTRRRLMLIGIPAASVTAMRELQA